MHFGFNLAYNQHFQFDKMSKRVIGKRFEQLQCGKHLGDTKKKFRWTFQIGEREYDLQLVNSALSGKKVVTLNHQQIYTEKNILNFNFDFTYNVQGHSIRITKIADKVNNFTLRIDNRDFDDLTHGRNISIEIQKSSVTKQQSFDPFSQFATVAKKTNSSSSGFDEFDFDSFGSSQPSSKIQAKKPKQNYIDFGFANNKNQFQTNIFDMNQQQDNQFAKKFKEGELDLLSAENFSTNTYSYNNNYADLKKPSQAPSQLWSIDFQGQQQNKQKKWQDNLLPDFTMKQAANKVKMAAEGTRNKIMGYEDSLI